PDGEALLHGVLAEPDDDAVRLVYADWLADNGDPDRAEFIRLQIARARLPRSDQAWLTPTARERELLAANRERWLAPGPASARRHLSFERGFPGRAACEISQFITWGDEVWQAAPVTAADLSDFTLSSADFGTLEERQANMRALAAKPQLANLRHLTLGETAA